MTAALNRVPQGRAVEVGSASGSTRSRWHWRDWPVVVKLATVLLVPTIVALVAGVLRIVDQASAAPGYARISQIVRVQQQLSDLIGAIARERDAATSFVATGRVGDRRPLEAQFRSVDDGVRMVTGAAGQVAGLDFVRAPLGSLGALAPLRASVTTGFGPVEVVITEYSDAIDPLIDLDAALTRQLDDVAVTNNAAAAHDLLAGREQVSRQRAIVSAALYTNRLGPGQIEDLRTATVRLAAEQDAVRATLSPAERANAMAGAGPDAELARQRVLQLVLNRGIAGQPLNTSPQDWDQRNAVVVDNIAALEKGFRQRIEQTAQKLLDHVRTSAGLNSVVLFFALALGVLIAILVTRALLRPLGVLKRTALDVADRRLPEAMARIRDGEDPGSAIEPVPVGTREEIGQVARAFDEVHSQAVRLASEQAQLRANVNDIFVNLSRRTQGLVERQLKLIDRLESGEQDPQQLDNLFQLDHLATRMRRNSENLLVLAGTDATSRSGRPVRLIDVLRAAVSEVEQYQRLVLQQPPAVLVLGRTASDLVHLLAELLDNATQFSPPDSHVMVSSERTPDGAVTIEVADRGVGMTETELAEANRRLAGPAAVDGSVSRRMGLFVVGRLAGRQGIEVQLRRGEGGVGVWASVTMPARLVRASMEPVESLADDGPGAPGGRIGAPSAGGTRSGPVGVARPPLAGRNGVPTQRPRTAPEPATPAPEAKAAEPQNADPQNAEAQPTEIQPTEIQETEPQTAESQTAEAPPTETQSSGQAVAASPPAQGDEAHDEPVDGGTDAQRTADGASSPTVTDPLVAQSVLPQRNANRAGPAEPAAPPGPLATPVTEGPARVPAAGSGTDLFRATRPSVPGPVGPPQRVTLQHSTPIFDDVASAWFKEHEAVPVRWTAPSARGQAGATREMPARPTPSPSAPTPDAPAPDAPSADSPSAGGAREQVAASSSPPLTRRQPGRTLAGGGSNGAGRSLSPSRGAPVSASGSEWGSGDEGWRAAQALAQPVNTDVTATGLPRRQPRALLVPGAAGASDAAESTSAPRARSPEMIRGRLASYQQGIREGRQARAKPASNAAGPAPEQQDGEKEAR